MLSEAVGDLTRLAHQGSVVKVFAGYFFIQGLQTQEKSTMPKPATQPDAQGNVNTTDSSRSFDLHKSGSIKLQSCWLFSSSTKWSSPYY